MTREEYEKRVQEIYEKHGVVPTPVKTREEMIKVFYFWLCHTKKLIEFYFCSKIIIGV